MNCNLKIKTKSERHKEIFCSYFLGTRMRARHIRLTTIATHQTTGPIMIWTYTWPAIRQPETD